MLRLQAVVVGMSATDPVLVTLLADIHRCAEPHLADGCEKCREWAAVVEAHVQERIADGFDEGRTEGANAVLHEYEPDAKLRLLWLVEHVGEDNPYRAAAHRPKGGNDE